MRSDPTDVVVIGSGAGGAPAALELATAGLRVVLLDKGKSYRDEEYDHDEIRMCRRNFFVPFVKDEPHTIRWGEQAIATRTNEGWIANIVGGGTVHMSGYFMRMQPVDFRLRSTLGKIAGATIVDWPIPYESMRPFYDRAECALGVSGRWRSHPFEEPRTVDYPLPPLAEHPFADRIDAAAKRLGYHPFPTPRAIVSQEYRGRAACTYCALCGSYGCEAGSKSSTAAALLPAAVASGHLDLRPESMATEIRVGADGRADGVVYRNRSDELVFQPARCVVVACSAIETARLLLLSQSARFPKGLANQSGLVGRNLLFSGLAKGEALFRHRGRQGVDWLIDQAPFVQRSLQDFYLLRTATDGVRKAGTLLFAFHHPNPINTAERVAGGGEDALWGGRLKRALRDEAAGARCLVFEAFSEFLPTPGSYVDLDPTIKDRWGMPVARMTLSRHPLDFAASELLAQRGLAVLQALAPDAARITESRGQTMILQGGTCRFGRDPARSVLDPTCRAHDVSNLYVTDGSFLPTSSGVPFTLTIVANAFRVGDEIVRRFREGAL